MLKPKLQKKQIYLADARGKTLTDFSIGVGENNQCIFVFGDEFAVIDFEVYGECCYVDVGEADLYVGESRVSVLTTLGIMTSKNADSYYKQKQLERKQQLEQCERQKYEELKKKYGDG